MMRLLVVLVSCICCFLDLSSASEGDGKPAQQVLSSGTGLSGQPVNPAIGRQTFGGFPGVFPGTGSGGFLTGYPAGFPYFRGYTVDQYDHAICLMEPRTGVSNIRGTVRLRMRKRNLYFLQQRPLEIMVNVTGLNPNQQHAFHAHQFGDLSNGCQASGGIYNPYQTQHGSPGDVPFPYPGVKTRMVGDLGNLQADGFGQVNSVLYDSVAKLADQDVTDIVGRSLVIYDRPDDLGQTQTPNSLVDGNSGIPIACCVIGESSSANWPVNTNPTPFNPQLTSPQTFPQTNPLNPNFPQTNTLNPNFPQTNTFNPNFSQTNTLNPNFPQTSPFNPTNVNQPFNLMNPNLNPSTFNSPFVPFNTGFNPAMPFSGFSPRPGSTFGVNPFAAPNQPSPFTPSNQNPSGNQDTLLNNNPGLRQFPPESSTKK